MTALDVVGVISAVAGVTPVVIAVCRAWARTLRGRVERDGSLPPAEPALEGWCHCGLSVTVRYEPPDGGCVTVWTTPAATSAFGARERGRGPW
ncbi:hypothetical protein [Streptomyces sp. NPDC058613]|uniref:hypothetical protein n=1 Tax=Streptomyces sp. NPDC058613 TaxID=3346556 RepID=UPI003662AD98